MIMEIVSILVGLFLMCAMCQGGSGWESLIWFIDAPSLICVLALSAPILLRSGLGKDFLRAFKLLKKGYRCRLSELRRTLDAVELMQKQVLCAGVFSMIFSFVYVLATVNNLEYLGPNMAIAVLVVFYAVILEMLLLPLQIETKRRIIDYIAEEEESDADCAKDAKTTE